MVIIAIGAALMVPNIGGWLPNYRLRSATRDIVSTMRTAQMKAVSNNIEYRVNLDDASTWGSNYVLQHDSGGLINEGALQTHPSGIFISAITIPAKHAEFNPIPLLQQEASHCRIQKDRKERSHLHLPRGG